MSRLVSWCSFLLIGLAVDSSKTNKQFIAFYIANEIGGHTQNGLIIPDYRSVRHNGYGMGKLALRQ